MIKPTQSWRSTITDIINMVPTAMCIIYTHIRVMGVCGVEWTFADIFRMLTATVFDIFVLTLLVFCLCPRHKQWANSIVFCLSMTWGLSNVIYATYFSGYMPLQAVTQTSELYSLSLCSYIGNALKASDCFYVICSLILVALLHFHKERGSRYKPKRYFVFLSTTILACIVYFISLKLFLYDNHLTIPNSKTLAQLSLIPTRERLCLDPVLPIAQTGIIRGIILPPIMHRDHNEALTDEQYMAIDNKWKRQEETFSSPFNKDACKPYKKIVFIIAETYLASTANMQFGGREVTPFLNSLRKEDTVCYNDSMRSDTQLGNSSDGQFMYMTGIMPLRDRLTVDEITNSRFTTLPQMLKSEGFQCIMTVPTQPTLWNQDALSKVYGIDRLYSITDMSLNRWMTDNEVFTLAEEKGKRTSVPDIEFILTVTTHGTYKERKPETVRCHCYPKEFPAAMSEDFKNYLLACHYMDHEIKGYLDFIRKHYDMSSTLVVIASDHGWKDEPSLLPPHVDKDRISVLFVNANKKDMRCHGTISQIDVFTSLVDLLINSNTMAKTDSTWYGLGNSIFRSTKSSTDDTVWKLSSDIIYGKYFSSAKGHKPSLYSDKSLKVGSK